MSAPKFKTCQPDESFDSKAAGKEFLLIRNGVTRETTSELRHPGLRRMNIQKTKRLWAQGLSIKYGNRLTGTTRRSFC
jgi:hypothetical protein